MDNLTIVRISQEDLDYLKRKQRRAAVERDRTVPLHEVLHEALAGLRLEENELAARAGE